MDPYPSKDVEIRTVLMRHWRGLDRARLHTFLLWLIVYCVCLIFLTVYFAYSPFSFHFALISLAFLGFLLVTYCVVRCETELHFKTSKDHLTILSILSLLGFPLFIWLIYLPGLLNRNELGKNVRDFQIPSLFSSFILAVLYQFFIMPRHRRVFLVISITFAIINVCCVATINFEPPRGVFDVDEDLEPNYPVGKQMYILFFLQTLMIIVGLICDAHSAGSRGNIERKIVDAVTRRTELETLKDRQDQLLLSVIPAYLTDKVSKSWQSNKHHKLFHDLHVQSHDNVSILFADIVNFTVLAKQLGAKDLVRTLNELYSKFDEDAQKLQCMRIKFLGDCYYCVSGMPVNRPNHADMCVLMGLEMIKIIKQVRVATGVDVNMRIGINSGNVLCGILGLKRWCFDVFSEDVEIAEHCEATGKPGAVHITQKTKDMLVGDYCIVEANLEDPFLLKRGEPTYYILPDKATIVERTASIYRNKRRNLDLVGDEENMCSQNRLSLKTKFTKITESWGADSTYSTPFANLNRTSVTDVGSARRPINNNTVQCMTLIENNLNKMNFSNVKSVMNCTTKRNEDQTAKMLFPFAKKPININLSECSSLLILSIPLAVANFFTIFAYYPPDIHPLLVGQLCLCLLVLAVICIVEHITLVGHTMLTLVAFGVSLLIAIGSHITISFRSVIDEATQTPSLIWLPSAMCHICCIQVLYRLSYAFRCILATVDLSVFLILLIVFPGYGINYMLTSANYKMLPGQITTIIIHLVAAYVLLLFVEWITEYEHKIEAACDIAFKNEENDIQTIKDINTLLIENILPSTVAAKFLEPNRLVDELYARDHNNVCVMFASIPNFKEFSSQCETSRKLEYLRLLNEIICEFDKLLSKPKFSGIEKIKTVSSTYMAASGITEYDGDYNKQKNVLSMVEYALTMSAVLDQLNLDSFQNFHLRVGVSLGSVVAGVIGSQKPAFDIWSNTVNMASRMDSHGVVSQIHMTQEVADILINEGYEVKSCGKIKVKGVKDLMETFLLPLDCRRTSSISGAGQTGSKKYGAF